MDSPLQSDFRYGNVRCRIRLDRATELLEANDAGTTCLHLAATRGGFEFIPEQLLNPENLLRPDNRGDTPIHLAAFTGRLKDLPLLSLEATVLEQGDGDGMSVLAIADKKGHLNQIPKELLLSLPSYRRKYLMGLLSDEALKQIPDDFLSPDLWSERAADIKDNGTLYHVAARNGVLDLLPTEMLSPQCWLLCDELGSTPLHATAAKGPPGSLARLISRIPVDLPWEKVGAHGNTVLHAAAAGRQLAAVPSDQLTEERLGRRNRKGETVVDLAYDREGLKWIPEASHFLSRSHARERVKHALTTGRSDGIPASCFTNESLTDLFPSGSKEASAFELAQAHGTYHLLSHETLVDLAKKAISGFSKNPLHAAAAAGILDQLPETLLCPELLQMPDSNGVIPLHLALAGGFLDQVPKGALNPELLAASDKWGVTGFHLAAAVPGLASIPVEWFTREILLTKDSNDRSVADVVWENGHTNRLPEELRELSGRGILAKFENDLATRYPEAARYAQEHDGSLVDRGALSDAMLRFVRDWAESLKPPIPLDEQQAETVARIPHHIQVTARAGSGKTRSLVTRVLFLIKHCGANPHKILILAFNRKAVAEIRARLAKYLEEKERPHVLTFHALAWRIVRPDEEILFDQEGSDEGKRLSQTIQEIIRKQLRDGTLESELRDLMRINWEDSLARIVQKGFDLPEDEFIALRERLHDTTLDGRRVETEAHKCIGDFLLRHALDYSYRPTIWRQSGNSYAPAFVHTSAEGRRIVIEAVGKRAENPDAALAFWESDWATTSVRVELDAEALSGSKNLKDRLNSEFERLGIRLKPLSKDALWEKIRDKVIDAFTKSIQGFISRCQKECLWPDLLKNRIDAYHEPIELQSRFWDIAHRIFQLYEGKLGPRRTDFDRLMLEAAKRIADGDTLFSSESGKANIRDLDHILIDEFQDFSLLFDKLRSAMVKVNSDALYFCVGDDWQAINRFAGSNLRYFTGFTEEFQPSQKLEITTNYRSTSSIVDAGNRVMSGHGSPSSPKHEAPRGRILMAKSGKDSELSPAEDAASDRFGQLAVDILRLAQMPGMPMHHDSNAVPAAPEPTLAILTRTTSLPTPKGMRTVEQWQAGIRKFVPEPYRERIEFSTVHGFKGREATAVILVEPEIYPLIHPDAVLAAVFGDTFDSLVDDERRLFYVGVTRAEETLVLLKTNPEARTAFIETGSLETIDVSRLESNLLMGDEVIVSLRNAPSVRNLGAAGTKPLKEALKAPGAEFIWKPEQAEWIRRFPVETLDDASKFRDYLTEQPWLTSADQVIARLVGDKLSIEFLIIKGRLQRQGASFSPSQTEELETLPDEQRATITALLTHIHLDFGVPWPEFGYEGTNENGFCDGSMVTLAWPDQKVGIAFPGDPHEKMLQRGWEIQLADSLDQARLAAILSAPHPRWDDRGSSEAPQPLYQDGAESPETRGDPEFSADQAATLETFHTKVSGVTFDNRAAAISKLSPGDQVTLKRIPDHPADPNAIEVFSLEGNSLGYVPANLASRLTSRIDTIGGDLPAKITAATPDRLESHLSLSIEFQLPATAMRTPRSEPQ